jgi:hypothetical protein
VAHIICLHIVRAAQLAELGFVGDDPDRSSFGTRAVECALRSGQRLDPREIVDMQVEHALDGGYRLLIQVYAYARQRA